MTTPIAFKTLRDSPLFDSDYYASQLRARDLPAANLIEHYLSVGAGEGIDPHPLFDSRYYLAQYPDVANACMNPLVHYILHGAAEGRNPNRFFNSQFYRQAIPELAADGCKNPLQHYASTPTRQKSSPHELFDPQNYISCYPEVLLTGHEPLEHYLNIGFYERRRAALSFDKAFYAASYPDVANADIDPYVHFCRFGRDEGRLPRRPGAWALDDNVLALWSRRLQGTRHERGMSVYWGNAMTTTAQLTLFKQVVTAMPDVEFCIHEALLPELAFSAGNLKLLSSNFFEERFFASCGIFVNSSLDAPISELMLAACLAGLLIVSPSSAEVSHLLKPNRCSQIPCEVLLPGMVVHAITYALSNRDDALDRIKLADQRLLALKAVTDTSL